MDEFEELETACDWWDELGDDEKSLIILTEWRKRFL